MVELLKAPTAFRGPAQTYRNTDSGGRSSIQSNPTQSSPRKVNGVSGRTPTADAEGRACISQVSSSGNLAWSRTQRCHHTTHPRSTQLYSHLSVLAGLLIECGEASPSPRRKNHKRMAGEQQWRTLRAREFNHSGRLLAAAPCENSVSPRPPATHQTARWPAEMHDVTPKAAVCAVRRRRERPIS